MFALAATYWPRPARRAVESGFGEEHHIASLGNGTVDQAHNHTVIKVTADCSTTAALGTQAARTQPGPVVQACVRTFGFVQDNAMPFSPPPSAHPPIPFAQSHLHNHMPTQEAQTFISGCTSNFECLPCRTDSGVGKLAWGHTMHRVHTFTDQWMYHSSNSTDEAALGGAPASVARDPSE
jgi:hypothetical protein